MDSHPIFNPINLNSWPRRFYFDHYYHKVKCTYSITNYLDIGSLLKLCKKKSIKLYPAMIHLITTAVNQIEELRISYNSQGQLGIWDFMSPEYTVFHADDKTFSNIWTPYHEKFSVFNAAYLKDIEQYGNVKDFFAKGQSLENTFPISCTPMLDFTGFNLNIYDDGRYLSPIFTIGKYTEQNTRTMIPLAVQLHHATCDGYHASILFDLLKKLAANPLDWMDL